jgi:hypothetical protein
LSKHKAIIDAVKTEIDSLSSPPTSVIRDRLVVQETDLPGLPKIILTMGAEKEVRHTMGGGVIRQYEVMLSIIYAQNQKIQTDIDDAKARRETIRKRMVPDETTTQPLLGVAGLFDCDAVNLPAQDARYAEAQYERADLLLVFLCSESRYA